MSRTMSYIKKYFCAGLMMYISLIGLGACSLSNSAPSQNATPIKIGVSISVSGDFSDDGKALQKGYQLWQDAVNGRGGLLGRPVQFDFVNDDSTPEKVMANYQKMIMVNHDDLVVGPFSTGSTIAASSVVAPHEYAFIEGAGVAPKVFEPQYPDLFSVSLSATSYLKSFVYFILSLPRAERPKTIAYASSDNFFTQPQIDAAKALLDADGEQKVYYDVYSADTATTSTYTSEADNIIRANPDVVILGTDTPEGAVAYMQEFKKQNFNPSAIIATAGPDQGDQFTTPLGGPQYAEGIFVPNGGWFPEAQTFQNDQFVQDYVSMYGGSPDDISADTAEAYSVGQVLEQAVTKIHSINNAQLIQYLHKNSFNTLQGPVTFAQNGENTVAVAFLFQWQSGKLIVVYPNYAAQENPEFPKPDWP